jgi:cytochrome c oxidase subunit 2
MSTYEALEEIGQSGEAGTTTPLELFTEKNDDQQQNAGG